MAEALQQFSQIYLGGKDGVSQGQLRISSSGFVWKRSAGGKTVEIKREELDSLIWTKVTRGFQLGVRRKDGPTINFLGFREKDLEALSEFSKRAFSTAIEEQVMSTSGRNWGTVVVNGSSMSFMVDGKVAFELPLPDVASAQQQKDDVMLEFHVDDTAGDEKQDTLAEISFYVGPGNEDFPATEGDTSAKVLLDQLQPYTDAGAAATDEAVCSFGEIAVLAPRGRFDIELFLPFLKLVGQSQEFKVRYQSIQRIFVLPRPNTSQTLVVMSLDPAIRKGQTYYAHVLCQFPTDEEATIELEITPEQLAAKNEKCGGKLEETMSGPIYEVFARALKGLSGAKITRTGAFKNSTGDGHAVRCSYKADEGHLYPLDRAFFYVPKPTLLVPYEDVTSVEFARQGGGIASARTFDLVVRTKYDVEHVFRSIQKTEWQNLLEFMISKKLRIENLKSAQRGPGGAAPSLALDEEGGAGVDDDEDESDEDFAGDSEEESEEESSDDDSDAEMVDEEGIKVGDIDSKKRKSRDADSASESDEEDEGEQEEKPAKKPKKAAPPKAAAAPKAAAKGKEKPAAEDGKGKKARKKKDPNAPKAAMSAFMYFSNAMRDTVKAENPGIAFGEVGKVLGEKWKAIDPAEKSKYEAMAAKDKQRYQAEMAKYKGGGAAAAAEEGGDDGSDAEDE